MAAPITNQGRGLNYKKLATYFAFNCRLALDQLTFSALKAFHVWSPLSRRICLADSQNEGGSIQIDCPKGRTSNTFAWIQNVETTKQTEAFAAQITLALSKGG